MKIISESTEVIRKNIRTFKVENGPTLETGPLWKDDIFFVVDTVRVQWDDRSLNRLVTVQGPRVRDGQINASYRHSRAFTDIPEWLKPLVDTTR